MSDEEKDARIDDYEPRYVEDEQQLDDIGVERTELDEDVEENKDDVQIDDRDDDQYEKILSYDYKYAAPVASSELEDKVPIPHTDYNFDEKDYRRHRKISQHYHEPIRPLAKGKSKKKKRSHKDEKKTEKEKFVKSPQKFPMIKIMPQISEHKELTQEQISDHESELAVWPKVYSQVCNVYNFLHNYILLVFMQRMK